MSSYRSYVRLAPGIDGAAYAAGVPSRVQAVDPIADMWTGRRFAALPMTDFYLSGIEENSAFTGKAGYMKLFGAIALVILLIAILNYVNLATASGMRMAKEVGVRKAVGSGRGQVARGLLIEALMLVGLSFALSVGLVVLATPLVNSFFDKGITLGWDALPVWASAFGLMTLVGLLAGAYPALVLSRFSPARVLKSGPNGAIGGTWLRRGLVVTQFAATIGLLVFTGFVFRQLDHVESRYPMPDDSKLAVLTLEREWSKRSATVEDALSELPGVTGTAAATGVPGQIGNRYGFLPDGPDAEYDIIAGFFGDRNFADLIGMPTAHEASDASPGEFRVFVNESAMQRAALDWSPGVAFPVGVVEGGVDGRETTQLAGVLTDFPYESLRDPIAPLFYAEAPDTSRFQYVVTRVASDSVGAFQAALPAVWSQFSNGVPDVEFVDEYVAELYEAERQLAQLVTLLAIVGLFVACLGLFGLAAHAASQRRKEISVRKVLGAGVAGLIGRLMREFGVLVGVAFLVAAPVSYLLVSDWLQGFVDQTRVGPGVFVGVLGLVLVLALVTVSFHAWQAATRNPADVLRSE